MKGKEGSWVQIDHRPESGQAVAPFKHKIFRDVNTTQALKYFGAPGFKPTVQKQRGRRGTQETPGVPVLNVFEGMRVALGKERIGRRGWAGMFPPCWDLLGFIFHPG